jgi:hypothetical protein
VPFIAGVTFDDYAWMIVGRSVTQQIYTQEGAGHDIYNALACGLVAQPVLARSFGHTGPDLYRIPRLDRVKEKVLSSNESQEMRRSECGNDLSSDPQSRLHVWLGEYRASPT